METFFLRGPRFESLRMVFFIYKKFTIFVFCTIEIPKYEFKWLMNFS